MLQSALDHYARQQRFTVSALIASRRPRMTPTELAKIVAAIQLVSAQDAIDSIDPMLDEQGIDSPLNGTIPAQAFAGTASDGRPLGSLFEQATDQSSLEMMVITQVQDAARQAAGVSIAGRPDIGYVRMLNPPSCSRCAVLAGKFFRYNQGFQRHPRCDCRHIPAREDVGDLTTRPDQYFDSLSRLDQDRIFTKGGAEAIRQGADIGQVVNARRVSSGMQVAGINPVKGDARGNLFTTEGSTRRGLAGQQQAGLRQNGPQQQRLMPESILVRAKDREDAQRLLKLYGYILDAPAAAQGRAILADARRVERNARARAKRAAAK